MSVYPTSASSVYLKIYVITPSGFLSAASLQLAMQEAVGVLGESGVRLYSISTPSPSPQQSRRNTAAIAAGVSVRIVVFIGIGILLACVW